MRERYAGAGAIVTAVQALVDDVAGTHGSLDLMFNNAGIVFGASG